jgi:hypothetical protein
MLLGAAIAGMTALLVGQWSDVLAASGGGMVMGWLANLLFVQRQAKRSIGRRELWWVVGGAIVPGVVFAALVGHWAVFLIALPGGAFVGALMPAMLDFNRKIRAQTKRRMAQDTGDEVQ